VSAKLICPMRRSAIFPSSESLAKGITARYFCKALANADDPVPTNIAVWQ